MTLISIIFQAAKLGDKSKLLDEFAWSEKLALKDTDDLRVYGISGGSLAALAYTLALSAKRTPEIWGGADKSVSEFTSFLRSASSHHIRALNLNPWYGIYNLGPLQKWVGAWLKAVCGRDNPNLSELRVPLYLCAMERDGVFSLFGPPDGSLQFQYQRVHVGPPQDAPILDALGAALSTLLSTSPVLIHGEWYRDCRPTYVDAGAVISDLESASGSE